MGLESRHRNISILILSKRPLVNDSGVFGIVEYAGCDPRLHVMGCVNTFHTERGPLRKKQRTSSTSHPPRLTPRTFCAPYGKLGPNDARAEGRRPARVRRTVDAADENISRSDYGEGKKKSPQTKRHDPARMPSFITQSEARKKKTGRRQKKAQTSKPRAIVIERFIEICMEPEGPGMRTMRARHGGK